MDNPTLDVIHEKYLTCLRTFAKKHFPNQPNRVEELLVRLPEVSYLLSEYIVASIYIILKYTYLFQVQTAASLLLESKMFYVPFLLNSTIDWPLQEAFLWWMSFHELKINTILWEKTMKNIATDDEIHTANPIWRSIYYCFVL